MHGTCFGVFRPFFLLWTESSNKKEPWYIGDKIKIINARLKNAKPPSEITRVLSSLDDIPHMKASQFRTLGIYLFPVFEGILPEPYFSHFCCLSLAIYTLLQDEVELADVKKAGDLLDYFVLESETLYGRKNITYCIHMLTHLSQSVQDWGCLWASSTFIPEWFNGDLQNLCNGTQAVVQQTGFNFLLRNAVREEVVNLLKDERQEVPKLVVSLFQKLLCLPKSSYDRYKEPESKYLIDSQISFLGNPEKRNLNVEEDVAISNLFQLPQWNSDLKYEIKFYPRTRSKNGNIFTTTSYTRSTKRINYCCVQSNGNFFIIDKIVSLELQHSRIIGLVLGRNLEEY